MTFDITLPVLNEEETLDRQVRILHQFLKDHFPQAGQWRIVIADNGSTDRTLDIAQTLRRDLPEVTVVHVPRKGVGLALKTSWDQSQAEIVGYMDLDLATDLRHFPEAYRVIAEENFDFVYATRLHRNSRVIGRTLKREITSRAFNFILKIYLGVRLSDGMCGFKFLKRSAYPRLRQAGAENDGWFFSTELAVLAEWMGLRLFELPVTWTDDTSSSRVKIFSLARKYLLGMRELRRKKQLL